MTGELVISLDFELLWGVRDVADKQSYGKNILGAREAIPQILSLFEELGVRATWATVGFLFCESKEELLASLPKPELRPKYTESFISSYNYIEEVGVDEASDPYYFAPSLIERISSTPGQEIATHTLSHYYCLEEGQSPATFEADLNAALQLATSRGIEIRSIVFPRNQYSAAHLDICHRHGITAYRGSPNFWPYRPTKWSEQSLTRRGLRLADAHCRLFGHKTYYRTQGQPCDIPASQFLRPSTGLLSYGHPLHVYKIKAGISHAAKTGSGYHLWWHPHNFGANTEGCLHTLRDILTHFGKMKEKYEMTSRTMAESAQAQW